MQIHQGRKRLFAVGRYSMAGRQLNTVFPQSRESREGEGTRGGGGGAEEDGEMDAGAGLTLSFFTQC